MQTSTIGKSNNPSQMKQKNSESGLTLIELIVVITVMSVVLFLTLPKFQMGVMADPSRKASQWIILNVQALKEKALRDQQLLTLHISIESGKLWISSSADSPESPADPEKSGFTLPEGLRIVDVEYPDKGKIAFGQVEIQFYKQGYSDKAIIHMENEDYDQWSFYIEPFLTKVRRLNLYAGFEG